MTCGTVVLNSIGSPLVSFTYPTVPGDLVEIDFTGLVDVVLQDPMPGYTVTCTATEKSVGIVATGFSVTFTLIGGSLANASPLSVGPAASLYLNATYMCDMYFCTYDLNTSGGVGGADLSIWLDDFGTTANPTRSDYDSNEIVGGADLSMWLDYFGAAASSSPATTCN